MSLIKCVSTKMVWRQFIYKLGYRKYPIKGHWKSLREGGGGKTKLFEKTMQLKKKILGMKGYQTQTTHRGVHRYPLELHIPVQNRTGHYKHCWNWGGILFKLRVGECWADVEIWGIWHANKNIKDMVYQLSIAHGAVFNLFFL